MIPHYSCTRMRKRWGDAIFFCEFLLSRRRRELSDCRLRMAAEVTKMKAIFYYVSLLPIIWWHTTMQVETKTILNQKDWQGEEKDGWEGPTECRDKEKAAVGKGSSSTIKWLPRRLEVCCTRWFFCPGNYHHQMEIVNRSSSATTTSSLTLWPDFIFA